MMEDTIMIRLSFENEEEIFSPSQKSEERKRCWLFLKPQQHKTIADITAHILDAFQLHHSCPHGIHLYVDGFPLQPFELTGILSISDTISVRKKRAALSLKASHEGQEARKYQLRGLEESGNATSKKRKASANLHSTKKIKQCSGVQDSVWGDATANQVQKSSQCKVHSSQVNIQKQELNLKMKKRDNNGKDNIKTSNTEISTDTKSSDDIQNNANDALEGPVETEKISTSAHSKKAKRQWLQEESVKLQKQNEIVQNGLQYSKESPSVSKADTYQPKSCQSGQQTRPESERNGNNIREQANHHSNMGDEVVPVAVRPDHIQTNQQSDTDDDELVPVVIRPGHIRFVPKDKEL